MAAVPFDQPLSHRIEIPSDLREARVVEDQILTQINALDYSQEAVFAIRLAIEEALVNAHRHGNAGDPDKSIIISYEITPERVIIRVRDQGVGFDPEAVPDPTHPDRIPLPHGRGIMLMRSYLDELVFNSVGNEVQMVKERNG